MLSSTSSSRRPTGGWGRTWALSLVLLLVAGASVELALRAAGFRPSFPETPSLWAAERERAVGTEPVVLLGFSRMQLGVDPRVLRDELGRPVVQLAINGTSPMPIFAELAEDERFAGTVWLSVIEGDLFQHEGDARAYLEYLDQNRGNLNRRLNRMAATSLTERLAMKSPQARLLAWWENWLRGLPNDAPYIVMRADRHRMADYQAVDIEAHRAQVRNAWERFLAPFEEWVERPDSRSIFADSVAVLDRRIRAIEARGGEVVLFRFPVSGPLRSAEQRLFPREDYWNVLVDGTEALAIHFEDYERLSGVTLPDDSHVDMRDTPAFTRDLARIVESRQGS